MRYSVFFSTLFREAKTIIYTRILHCVLRYELENVLQTIACSKSKREMKLEITFNTYAIT